jgi:hypothetical protein
VFETCLADLNVLKQRIVEEVNAMPVNTLSHIMKSMANMNGWHLSEVNLKK